MAAMCPPPRRRWLRQAGILSGNGGTNYQCNFLIANTRYHTVLMPLSKPCVCLRSVGSNATGAIRFHTVYICGRIWSPGLLPKGIPNMAALLRYLGSGPA
jgi:hypothetical protein